jgi:hypothetical protein
VSVREASHLDAYCCTDQDTATTTNRDTVGSANNGYPNCSADLGYPNGGTNKRPSDSAADNLGPSDGAADDFGCPFGGANHGLIVLNRHMADRKSIN